MHELDSLIKYAGMKERVVVKYSYQNDPHDKSPNCFFLLKDDERPLRIIDLLADFPAFKTGEYLGKGLHFRFLDKFGKNFCWVDIKNLQAIVPIHKGMIEMRVLIMPEQTDSLIFGNIFKELSDRSSRSANQTRSPAAQPRQPQTPQPELPARPKSHLSTKPKAEPPSIPKPVPAQVDLINDDDFEPFETFEPAELPSKPKTLKTSSQPKMGLVEEVDILGGDIHMPVTDDQKPAMSDEQRMNEMFGADFNPLDRNRVLDVIYIQQNKTKAAQYNIEAIESRRKRLMEQQDAKLQASVELEPKVKQWALASNGQKNNIRILLSTLHSILWEGAGWEPISMADMVSDSSVKKNYVRAITKVHPDQNQEIDDPKIMYMMDRVFNVLNDSYTEFTKIKTK